MQNNSVSQSTDKMKGNGNGKWAQAEKAATEEISSMTDSARQIYDQAVEAGSDFISQANKKATEVVREYPVYATLGGLCVGFLLGASLFGRRVSKEA